MAGRAGQRRGGGATPGRGTPCRSRAWAEPHRVRRLEKGRGVLTARDEGGAGSESEVGGGDVREGRGEGERERGFVGLTGGSHRRGRRRLNHRAHGARGGGGGG
jgi:hypothetical protein